MINYLQRENPPTLKSVEDWQSEFGPGLKLTTSHYEIFTTLLDPLMLSQLPPFMESAYKSYQKQLPKPIDTASAFTVYLFADRQQWENFTRSFTGKQAPIYLKIKAGAYYLNGICVAYNIGSERTFSALGHEGWHQFNSRHFQLRLPSWLDEGIAMLFESGTYRHGRFHFEPARNINRLAMLKKTLIENKMIPLKKLIAMNPGEALSLSDDTVAAFYAQSYALVRFLREEGHGQRLQDYHQMLLGGLTGNWPITETAKKMAADRNIPLTIRWNQQIGPLLFEYYIGSDIQNIEQEYLRFCRKIVFHIHITN